MQKYRRDILASRSLRKEGRPRKLSPTSAHYLVHHVQTGKVGTAAEAARVLTETRSVRIPRQTAARYLKKDGMRADIKKLKSMLTRKMKKVRLNFAEADKE